MVMLGAPLMSLPQVAFNDATVERTRNVLCEFSIGLVEMSLDLLRSLSR